VDLSHWDLVERLSLFEAASLATGIDPLLTNLPDEAVARRALVLRELTRAYEDTIAITEVWLDFPEPDEKKRRDPIFSRHLVSCELRLAVHEAVDTGLEKLPDWFYAEHIKTDTTFAREDLSKWFAHKRYVSSYSFVQQTSSDTSVDHVDEDLVNTRLRNNLLRLILALAFGVPGFDPKKPYEAAKAIIDHTEIKLGEKTIAKYITEALSLQSKERE
jgi:hypothetical protein